MMELHLGDVGKLLLVVMLLSRHFRTETGWLCIRPLMEEAKRLEEEEQQRQQQAQQQQQVPQQSQVSEQIG